MIRMRKAGFTYREIAAKADIPWGTVRSRLQAWGVKPEATVIRSRRRKIKNDYPRWLIDEMYWSCKLSSVEIAYELDIPDESVCTMMRRMKIPFRSRKEAQELYCQRHPHARIPVTANREMALRASMISAQRRRQRAKKNLRRREERAALAAA
jgi:hypothetical protein